MGNYLTEVGNLNFMFIAMLWMFYIVKWGKSKRIHPSNKHVMVAFSFVAIAIFIRMGWWWLALVSAPNGEMYHEFFMEYKWTMAVPTSMLFGLGVLNFIQFSEGFSKKRKFELLGALFACALLVGLI